MNSRFAWFAAETNSAVNSMDPQNKAGNIKSGSLARRKLKILELCAVDFTIYHFILPLARELTDQFDVHFCSSPGPYVDRIRAEGFAFHGVPISRSYNLLAHMASLKALRKLMVREKFDVVHAHTPIASLIGRFAARLCAVPLVLYTAHGFYFHERMKPLTRRMFVGLEKLGGMFTDHIFTVSGEDFQSAVSLNIIRKDKVEHCGNGVNLDRFNPARFAGERADIRRRLGIADSRPVVSIVGRLVREKGYIELVEAVRFIVQTVPDVLVLVIGGALQSDYDDASHDIMKAVEDKGLEDNFLFLSFRADVDELLYASDLFTLPSYREGLPVSVMEAMAMELPVVATNIRGSREAVRDGLSGLLVEVGDVEGLAAAITSLLVNDKRRREMGKEGRAIACERYDEKVVVAKQKARILQLAEQKGLYL
ncbi:MAG: glycosyltransferase family 4 protein [Candidatus Latescibacterota bacterium]